MAETPVLEAVARAGVGKGAARSARREGFVPGVIYGGGDAPQPINVKFNTLLKQLKAGRFLSTLINVKVDGKDNAVICRSVQRDVVKDLPTHVDFLRLSEKSRIALYIPVDYVNRDKSPGLKRGGVLTEVRPEVELMVTAGDIPESVVVDLTGTDIHDTHPHLQCGAAGGHPADDHRPRLRDRQHPGAVGPALRRRRDRGRRGRGGLIRAAGSVLDAKARRGPPRRVLHFRGGAMKLFVGLGNPGRGLRPQPAQHRLHGGRRHRRGARLRARGAASSTASSPRAGSGPRRCCC